MEAIQEYADITELDAATLNRLIKEIVVHGATSIHVQAAKPGSEIHNFREKELDYVRPELSHLCMSDRLIIPLGI